MNEFFNIGSLDMTALTRHRSAGHILCAWPWRHLREFLLPMGKLVRWGMESFVQVSPLHLEALPQIKVWSGALTESISPLQATQPQERGGAEPAPNLIFSAVSVNVFQRIEEGPGFSHQWSSMGESISTGEKSSSEETSFTKEKRENVKSL